MRELCAENKRLRVEVSRLQSVADHNAAVCQQLEQQLAEARKSCGVTNNNGSEIRSCEYYKQENERLRQKLADTPVLKSSYQYKAGMERAAEIVSQYCPAGEIAIRAEIGE